MILFFDQDVVAFRGPEYIHEEMPGYRSNSEGNSADKEKPVKFRIGAKIFLSNQLRTSL